MQDIELVAKGRDHRYHILVGHGLLGRAGELLRADKYTKAFVITDEQTAELWLDKLMPSLPKGTAHVLLPIGEQAKTLGSVEKIWTAMEEAALDRQSLVVILGGGVCGDMGAFAASTYMRGVAFVQVPTTLLAQVDSSIGGKTGIDFAGLKNFIGTFAQPVAVLADTDVLKTLPRRQLVAGFGEMFKHGLVRDAGYFEQLVQKRPQDFTADELEDFIAKSVRIKAEIVAKDEQEAGSRKLVNFGHTVGHAVEELSWKTSHPLLHGEAVAIGMVVETELSWREGHLGAGDVKKVKAAIEAAGLPVSVPQLPVDEVIRKMRLDKKDIGGVIEFDLLDAIGRARFNQTVDEAVLKEVLEHNMEPSHAE